MSTLSIHTNDEAVRAICKSDVTMEKLIRAIGDIHISLRTDYLASIVRSIVGQQISVQAASTIYERLNDLLGGEITVEGLLGKSQEELRQVGLTMRKAEYVKDLARKVADKELDLENLETYDNNDIMEQLINVKGIGKWTAQMFLLLSLGREDVLAVDDVGIQRAAQWLFQVEKSERRSILIEKSPNWEPYRSIVSFYLWEATHLGFLNEYETVDDATL